MNQRLTLDEAAALARELAVSNPRDPALHPAIHKFVSALVWSLLKRERVESDFPEAVSDGKLDPAETQAILARLEQSDLEPEEKGALVNELSRPIDMDSLVSRVRTPQEAMEVYVASLLAIEADTAAEKAYLAMLAARLELDEALVTELHRQVAAS